LLSHRTGIISLNAAIRLMALTPTVVVDDSRRRRRRRRRRRKMQR